MNTIKPKQLLLGLLIVCHYAFGINDYQQIREHIKALKSQEYLTGVVIIDMQITADHIQGNPPSLELASDVVQVVFEQGGPVAQLYYFDQKSAPLRSVQPISNLVSQPIRASKRYYIDTRWLICPTNHMSNIITFMLRHGVTHLLVIGSNHNNAVEYMVREASFHGINTFTFSTLIAQTTLLQDLTHAQLSKSLHDYEFYTSIRLNCVPDRDDDLENRTTIKLNSHMHETALKQTSLF